MTSWIDRQLGKLSMYHLVMWALVLLAIYSLILNILLWLPFDTFSMVANLVVAPAVTLGTSLVFSWIFRLFSSSSLPQTVWLSSVNWPSSVITGLLLYFLFSPRLLYETASGAPWFNTQFWSLVLAAVIAGASKFVLAFRGRHIFNPAAIGAFAVSLLGLANAKWWVATPTMLWLVLPLVVVILHRMSKLSLAWVFLLVSTPLILMRYFPGAPELGTLAVPFLSLPAIFLVGFMLSEPLTLPSRRWQQWLVAGFVGVLYAVPFQFPPVYSSPELALLCGNLLAFALSPRRRLSLRYTGAQQLSPSSKEYSFTPSYPVPFQAGQYLELTLPHRGSDSRGIRRVFSLSSGTEDATKVSVGLRLAQPSSSFKAALERLAPGDTLEATGIWGDMLFPQKPEKLLLLASGIGVTPFISLLRSLEQQAPETAGSSIADHEITLIYAISKPDDAPYREELEQLAQKLGVNFQLVVGGGAQVAEQLSAITDISQRRVYISGAPHVVSYLRSQSRKRGARHIHTDIFFGY